MKHLHSIRAAFDKINSQTVRERAIILATSLSVTAAICLNFGLDPLLKEKHEMAGIIQQKEIQKNDAETKLKILKMEYEIDPNQALKAQKDQTQTQIAKIEKELDALMHSLVPPQKMVKVIKDLFFNQRGMKLLSLENLPPLPMVYVRENKNSDKPDAMTVEELYRHGIKITFEGNYYEVTNYLEILEALPWRFYWHKIDYQVTDYPKAEITLEIHTFSRYEGVLGV